MSYDPHKTVDVFGTQGGVTEIDLGEIFAVVATDQNGADYIVLAAPCWPFGSVLEHGDNISRLARSLKPGFVKFPEGCDLKTGMVWEQIYINSGNVESVIPHTGSVFEIICKNYNDRKSVHRLAVVAPDMDVSRELGL